MAAHPVIRRYTPPLLGVALAAALGATWSLPGRADTTMLMPPAAADRSAEPSPGPRNEPLVDPRAERTNRAEAGPGDIFLVPYGIERGACDRRRLANDTFGGVVGLVGGGIASETVAAAGRSKAPYAVAGAAAGPLVGARLARLMDEVDHHCIGRTLEYAPDHHRVGWQNDSKDLSYVVVPVRTFQNQSGLYCREYLARVAVAGKPIENLAAACRGATGAWKLLRSD
jgi:surface antigen